MDVDDSKEVDLEEFQRFWISHVLPHLWSEMTAPASFLRDSDGDDEEETDEPVLMTASRAEPDTSEQADPKDAKRALFGAADGLAISLSSSMGAGTQVDAGTLVPSAVSSVAAPSAARQLSVHDGPSKATAKASAKATAKPAAKPTTAGHLDSAPPPSRTARGAFGDSGGLPSAPSGGFDPAMHRSADAMAQDMAAAAAAATRPEGLSASAGASAGARMTPGSASRPYRDTGWSLLTLELS